MTILQKWVTTPLGSIFKQQRTIIPFVRFWNLEDIPMHQQVNQLSVGDCDHDVKHLSFIWKLYIKVHDIGEAM
jgi:hypothetical protein